MAIRTLQITLGSAQKLKKIYRPWPLKKMDVYVLVSVTDSRGNGSSPWIRTRVHMGGDANSQWDGNQVHFDVDMGALRAGRLTLKFKVMCQRYSSRDDEVLAVLSYPMDQLRHRLADGQVHAVTGDLRKPDGRATKGSELNFDCQLVREGAPPPPPPPPPVPVERHTVAKGVVVYFIGLWKTVARTVRTEWNR